jgi:hypothetical protein
MPERRGRPSAAQKEPPILHSYRIAVLFQAWILGSHSAPLRLPVDDEGGGVRHASGKAAAPAPFPVKAAG